jgi:uncharacterized coiled-coil DUF342 family protein
VEEKAQIEKNKVNRKEIKNSLNKCFFKFITHQQQIEKFHATEREVITLEKRIHELVKFKMM